MEVADEIAVVNDGVIEQVGKPEDLYDRPANEFVMRFLGAVTNLDGALVRPHDIEVLREIEHGTTPARIERLVRLGFEVRVEAVTVESGEAVAVQLTRAQAESLELSRGTEVHLRPIALAAQNAPA